MLWTDRSIYSWPSFALRPIPSSLPPASAVFDFAPPLAPWPKLLKSDCRFPDPYNSRYFGRGGILSAACIVLGQRILTGLAVWIETSQTVGEVKLLQVDKQVERRSLWALTYLHPLSNRPSDASFKLSPRLLAFRIAD